MLIPRNVVFLNGICIGAGNGCKASEHPGSISKVMYLNTDHYDFLGYNPKGKTEEEILRDNPVK